MHVMREMVLHNLGENRQSVMYSKRHQTSDLLKELNTRKLLAKNRKNRYYSFFSPKMSLTKAEKKIPNIYFYFISYYYVSSPPGSAIDSSVMILVMIRRSGTRYECTGLLLFRNRTLVYSYLVPDLLIITNIITDEWTAEPGGENAFS